MHFLHASPEGVSTTSWKSHPLSCQLHASPDSRVSLIILHYVDICYTENPQPARRSVENHMFSPWSRTIVHSDTPASAYLFVVKSHIGPCRWLFPAKSSHLFNKDGCTVAEILCFPFPFLRPFPVSEFMLILCFLSPSCHWSPSPSCPFTSHPFILPSGRYANEL